MTNAIRAIFNVVFNVWNWFMEIAMTLFTTAPNEASGMDGKLINTVHRLYNALFSFALPITVIFLFIALLKNSWIKSEEQRLPAMLSDLMRYGVIVVILASLWDIMGYIMSVTNNIMNVVIDSNITYKLNPNDQKVLMDVIADFELRQCEGIDDLIPWLGEMLICLLTDLLFMIVGLVVVVLVAGAGFTIVSVAFQRILKPLVILPFASIMVAVGAGGGDVGRVALSYLKTFVAFCISGAFMVAAIKVGVAFCSNGLFNFDMTDMGKIEKMILVSVHTAATPMVIAGLVKSMDGIIARFL